MSEHEKWFDEVQPSHERLTESVVTIIENLLKSKGVDYLSVSGRTKEKKSALEKIARKKYKEPSKEMTDLSGIRIIVFIESDIKKVSQIIEDAFNIDKENSSNQDKKLSVDRIGYRSVHFVCDIGDERASLPENDGLKGLKFEFQVRTILQHAWAELAHDNSYKFKEGLPPDLERRLYLYAGMLEIADRGLNELSQEVTVYRKSIHEGISSGDLDHIIDVISLDEFISNWANKNNIKLEPVQDSYRDVSVVIEELHDFGITTIKGLSDIIPEGYADKIKKIPESQTIVGLIRDWMIINDLERYRDTTNYTWKIFKEDLVYYKQLLDSNTYDKFCNVFSDWIVDKE
ncbi:GTP pyrophosphokinase family protein [Proteus mirabilis]|uniref:GTP pyrophosphokinase n=1 Tax=Proteus mirabilis TaxID=584 RepID=UPI0013EBE16C|nr:GTP pyrophosphokinase [Proteus mirabilis]MDM3553215.1 GTP pyrophosphokinase [Proteus mirabilis]HCR4060906.1 GTP pyrophosphokinase [Proteus mirabilis]HCT6315845.1 GTP pyrophosphokinase [Proteus mirabilis]HCT6320048.1 GTP pyrophosphokinase [Proteus mirabilis]HDU2615439.1 GTP pyrophosphokinase [Proteus mirabilis]